MTTKSGGQIPPTPNRRTGSKRHSSSFGAMQDRTSKRVNTKRFGPGHTLSGGPVGGGSGSARRTVRRGKR